MLDVLSAFVLRDVIWEERKPSSVSEWLDKVVRTRWNFRCIWVWSDVVRLAIVVPRDNSGMIISLPPREMIQEEDDLLYESWCKLLGLCPALSPKIITLPDPILSPLGTSEKPW